MTAAPARPAYVVAVDGDPIASTDWQPMAEAAWHRATRDQSRGGIVTLTRDGQQIARTPVLPGRGAAWPDGASCGLRDVVRALLQLLRDDDWNAQQLAAAMTAYGLPTSRARIDALRGAKGHPAELSHAEIVVLITAVLNEYKRGQ